MGVQRIDRRLDCGRRARRVDHRVDMGVFEIVPARERGHAPRSMVRDAVGGGAFACGDFCAEFRH